MKHLLTAVATLFVLAGMQLTAQATSVAVNPEVAFSNAFPQLKVDSIVDSQIKGVYEVTSGLNIFYFVPENDLLIVGEIYTKEGKNLTGDKKQELKAKTQAQAMNKLEGFAAGKGCQGR